jgi:protein TonB
MTTSSNFAYASLDDIVFEGRNREYGAYMLRKLYPTNLWRGLFLAISLFLLFLSLPLVINKLWPKEEVDTPIIEPIPVSPLDIVEPKPETPDPHVKPQKPASPPPSAPTQQLTVPQITALPHPNKEMPDVNLPKGIEPGATTNPGNGGKTVIPEPGTGTQPIIQPEPSPVLTFAEVNPAFPGGNEALFEYLSNNIRYPSLAERNRVEGLVVVQFVVNEEGAISDIMVVKNLGAGTDEEAIRVIKKMPPWSPGKQNGRAVKVRFTLPIRFLLKK